MVFIGMVKANDDNLELLSDVTGLALNCYRVSAVVAISTAPITVFDVNYHESLLVNEDGISSQCVNESLESLRELEKRAILYPDDTGTDNKTLSEIHFLEGDKIRYILRFHWQ